MRWPTTPWPRCALPTLLLLGALAACVGDGPSSPEAPGQTGGGNAPHSRQKRLLWVTNDGRLALPPGTALTITPTISMPFVRYPPDGFLSNMSISLPFTSEVWSGGSVCFYRFL